MITFVVMFVPKSQQLSAIGELIKKIKGLMDHPVLVLTKIKYRSTGGLDITKVKRECSPFPSLECIGPKFSHHLNLSFNLYLLFNNCRNVQTIFKLQSIGVD